MASTYQELEKKVDRLLESVQKAARPASGVSPVQGFAAWQGRTPGQDPNAWPMDRLATLSKAYNSESAARMLLSGNCGRPRACGWGKALVKMARLANPSLGGAEEGYDTEKFEKEYGFVTVEKAQRHGVPGINGEVRKTALAEGSGITGGYLVPPQFMNELLTIAAEDAFIEPRAKVIPMTSRTATFPMLDLTTSGATGVSPYFGGIVASWQPEAAQINETEPTFRQVELTAYDLVMYTVSSNQLLQDNGIGLDALLTQLFAQAMTWYKEYAFLRGAGAGNSMPLGVLNAPAAYLQSRAVSSRFVLADAAAMMSRLNPRSWDSACWVMHYSVIPQLIQMASGATSNTASTTYIPGNALVWTNPMPGNGIDGPAAQKLPKAFLNGLPLFFTEKLPSLGTQGDVVLVDWGRYLVGQRLDVQIDVSPHYLFRNNQLAWRVVARCDGKPWLNDTITDAAGWESSPFVVLN